MIYTSVVLQGCRSSGFFTNPRFLYFFNSHFLLHLKTYQLIPLIQLLSCWIESFGQFCYVLWLLLFVTAVFLLPQKRGWVRSWSSPYRSQLMTSRLLRSKLRRYWLLQTWPPKQGNAYYFRRIISLGSSVLETFLLFCREDIITVAPQDGIAEIGETNQLSKDETVIGNRTSCPPPPRQEIVEFEDFSHPIYANKPLYITSPHQPTCSFLYIDTNILKETQSYIWHWITILPPEHVRHPWLTVWVYTLKKKMIMCCLFNFLDERTNRIY